MKKKIWSKLLSCLVAVAMIFVMGANVMAEPVDGGSGTEVTEQQEDKETDNKQDDKKPEDQEKNEDPPAQQDDKESGDITVAGASAEEPAAEVAPKSEEPEAAPVPEEGGDTPDPSIYYTFTLREGNWNAADIVYSTSDPDCVASEPHERNNKFYYSDGHWSFYLSDSCPFTAPDGYEFDGWDIANGLKGTIIFDIQEDMVATAQWTKINTDNSKAGDNIIWKFNMNTGTLTLTGTGAMYDYNKYETPWYSVIDDIERIVVSEGITVIGEYAFCDCWYMYSITLPDSLTTIKNHAFENCASLEKIVIPAGVTAIGVSSDPEDEFSDAFRGCRYLYDVYLDANPANLTWNEEYNDFRLKDPQTVCHVRSEYLSGYNGNSFSEVNVKFEGDLCGPSMTWSFDEDSGELKLSGSGKMFDYADADSVPWSSVRNSITSLSIDNSGDITIGNNAFNGCVNLSGADLDDSGITSIGTSSFEGCTSFEDVTFPSSLTSIGSRAFYNSGIQWLTITKSINSIGSEAFKNCTSLLSVYLYSDRISIGKDAFYGCTKCYTIYIENNNLTAANIEWDENNCDDFNQNDPKTILLVGPSRLQSFIDKFSGKVNVEFREYQYCPPQGYPFGNGLTWRLDGDGILTISGSGDMPDFDYEQAPWSSFGESGRIVGVVIGDQITSIGNLSFCECKTIKSVTIPDSVTKIGYGAFMNCSALQTVTIPGSVKIIDKYAFQSCEFTSITICNGVESIGTNAFAYTKLRSVTIPDSVTYLGDYVFYDCGELKSAKLSKNLESIEEGTFSSCHKLYSVNIPDGVTSIGEEAFRGCSALSAANIPGSVKTIGDSAFMGCSHMKDLTIAYGVEKIGQAAFSTCQSLTSITIPDSVIFIDRTAFNMCINATEITLPSGITAISDYTFYNCINLKSVVIPNKVETIGAYAFTNCQKMESLIISESVTNIKDGAFDNCLVLKTITILSKNINIENSAFSSCPRVTDVYCYADPANVEWNFSNGYVFNGNRIVPRTEENAKIHVLTEFLSAYHEKFDSVLPSYIEFIGGAEEINMGSGNSHLYGYTLSLEGNIGVNFYMSLDEAITGNNSTAYMLFTVNGRTQEVMVKDLTATDDGYYIFRCNVAAKEMCDQITAQLYLADGVESGPSYTFAVRDYASYILNHTASGEIGHDPKVVALVKAMLNYGAYSQIYFNHNTGNLANSILDEDERTVSAVPEDKISQYSYSGDTVFDTGVRNISFISASLSAESEIYMNFYFTGLPTDTVVKCNGEVINTPLTSVGSYTRVCITGIKVQDINENYTITFTCDGTECTLVYSPMNYCYNIITRPVTPTRTQEQKDNIAALYWFYKAAENYISE